MPQKGVVAGVGNNGNKIIMAPMEKIKKIGNTSITTVDTSDVTLHKTITSDTFLDRYAVHSVAKMAYEWYCYVNNIEELRNEHQEIIDYILGNNTNNLVDIVIDEAYFSVIDEYSETGTNSFLQYDDIDGYRYVIFDLWKTIAYRVKICTSLLKKIDWTKPFASSTITPRTTRKSVFSIAFPPDFFKNDEIPEAVFWSKPSTASGILL